MNEINHEKNLEKRIIFIYILGFVLISVAYLAFYITYGDAIETAAFNTLIQVAYYAILTGYLVYISKQYLFNDESKKLKKNPTLAIGLIIAGFFLMFAVNGLIVIFTEALGYTETSLNQEQLEALAESGTLAFLGVAFIAIICAPIVEELVFRKGVYGLFDRKFNAVVAIFMSAFFFGFIHLMSEPTNILGLLPYLAMGISLGFIYFLSGKNIYVPIIIHALWNILAITVIALDIF